MPDKLEDVIAYDLLSTLVYEQDWALGYAFKFSERLAFGVEARRYKYGNNLRSSSRFWSVGFSVTYLFRDWLRFGLVSRNTVLNHYHKHRERIVFQVPGEPDVTISPINFDTLPHVFTEPEWRLDFGVAGRPLNKLLFSVDVYTNGRFGAGVEWQTLNGLYLRLGVSRKHDGLFKAEKFVALVPGLGWRYGVAQFDIALYWNDDELQPASESTSTGEFEISPSGTGRTVLFSALFFVK